MLSLSATLTQNQKRMGDALVRLVLTQQGNGNTYSYGLDTTNRILTLSHGEQEWAQTAQVLIDNRDKNLTALALEGYVGVISWGYKDPTQGEEYAATAPLTVIAGKGDSIPGELVTSLSLAGLFNLWGEQEATEAYTPDRINTDTVRTILDAIAGATLTCFNTSPAHTITYDSGYDDSIINAFTPKDAFSIAKGESRLSAFRKVLNYTKCKTRVRNDSGTATIHIFQPTITGTSYDYEFNDAIAAANHNFFDKSVRTRLVLPNRVVVMNHPDDEDSYIGGATDAASYAALGNQYYIQVEYVRADSHAQCALIAQAILQRHQLAAEKGHGIAPLNVGQEVMDYVKITDSRAGDTRVGNIGFLNRWYSHYPRPRTRFGFEFRFGDLLATGLAGTLSPRAAGAAAASQGALADAIISVYDDVVTLAINQTLLFDRVNAAIQVLGALRAGNLSVKRFSVTERFQGPMGTDKYD